MNKTPLVEFVYNRHKTVSATKEAALLPKQWHRGTVTNRVDAIQLNQTLEKLMIDVRQVVVNMMTEGSIDIFSIPDRLKRLRSGNINFLDFCDKRMKIRQYGKAEDSQERYTRFMKFFRDWGKIAEFEDITDLNIIAPIVSSIPSFLMLLMKATSNAIPTSGCALRRKSRRGALANTFHPRSLPL